LKSGFFDKVLGRIDRLHSEGLQTVVQRLVRERSFLETLFNTIEDGVLVADRGARILFFNRAATELLGLPAGAVEGLLVQRYLPALDWAKLCAPAGGGGPRIARHEFEVNYPRPRFLRLYAAPLEEEAGGNSGVVLILHDATEARQKTCEAIESERLRALTLLAASVAHEIGNPLNALSIHLQLMERELKKLKQTSASSGRAQAGPTGPRNRPSPYSDRTDWAATTTKLENYLDVAKGEIARLDYIVTQFLQAIRPTPLRPQMASLNDTVHATLELLRPELENRDLIVQEKLARQLPMVSLDAAQVKQVLVNLIKNAMQAMTKGGALTLQTGRNRDGVWVSVADTGGGIPPDRINHLFEPFYTTKDKGSGLGLMIVQRIVREHRGRIEVESWLGQGTTFRVWLPLEEPQPRLLEAPTP
jgi:two-component system, sporulation sensor kinase E